MTIVDKCCGSDHGRGGLFLKNLELSYWYVLFVVVVVVSQFSQFRVLKKKGIMWMNGRVPLNFKGRGNGRNYICEGPAWFTKKMPSGAVKNNGVLFYSASLMNYEVKHGCVS